MKNVLALSLVAILLSLRSLNALALTTDTEQPVEIEADFAELDDQQKQTTYTGNVVVVQGSIRMTGDKLIANFDDDRQMQDVYLDGKPAFFKQTPDGAKQDIEGEGLKIEYHAQKNLLYLIDKARLKQGERLFEGYRINYDTKNSIITGRGAPSAAKEDGAAPRRSGRVKVIIPPKHKNVPPN
ncbi:MAG: lipopolysaccharide transport periplasmic protein LptA [Gammaproteobacteria bacterium]|nr:lipopolysaccharide transport periplasmic protein LptA [Gammaproteobacteria bacterium]